MNLEIVAEMEGAGASVARKKRTTAFLLKKEKIKEWIRRKLRGNNKAKLVYLECFDTFFPRGTPKEYFKQYFDNWTMQVKEELGLVKKGGKKIVFVSNPLPRSVTTPVLPSHKVSASSSIFKKKEYLIVPRINAALRHNQNTVLDYVAFFKEFFPHEPRMDVFKQYFDRWVLRERKRLGLPLKPNTKKVSRKVLIARLRLSAKKEPSVFSSKDKEIIEKIKAILTQDNNAVFDYVVFFNEFFPSGYKVGVFKQRFDRLVGRARNELRLPKKPWLREKEIPREISLSDGRVVPLVHFRPHIYSLKGLPAALQKFIIENPGKRIPTMQFAVQFGVVRKGEREKIMAGIESGSISIAEGKKKLIDFKRRLQRFLSVKCRLAAKIQRTIKIKQKIRAGVYLPKTSTRRKLRR